MDKHKPDFPDKLQFGFRKQHGAVMSVYTLVESIKQYLNNGSSVFSAFLHPVYTANIYT